MGKFCCWKSQKYYGFQSTVRTRTAGFWIWCCVGKMASVYASVHVSTNPLSFLLRLRQNFIERGPKLLALRPVSCSSSSSTLPNENRRSVSISILLVSHLFFTPDCKSYLFFLIYSTPIIHFSNSLSVFLIS